MRSSRKFLSIFLIFLMVGLSVSSLAHASGSTYPQSYSSTAYENATVDYYYLASQTANTNFQASTPSNSSNNYINQDSSSGVWVLYTDYPSEYATYAIPSGQQYISGSMFNAYADWAFQPAQAQDNSNLPYVGEVGVYLVNGGNLATDAENIISNVYGGNLNSPGAGTNAVASWSYTFNEAEGSSSTSSDWVYINPTFSIPSGTVQPITGIIFINIDLSSVIELSSVGNGGLIDFAEATANDNSINNGPPEYNANSIGYTGYTTPTTLSSWTIPSNTQTYTITWSAPYDAAVSYNGNTQYGTSGSFTGSTGNPDISAYFKYWVSGTQTISTTETFQVATSDSSTLSTTTGYTINQQTSNTTYYESSFSFSFSTPSNAITGNSNFEISWTVAVSDLWDVFYSSSGSDSWSFTLTPGSISAQSGTTYRSVTNIYSTTSGGTVTWDMSTTEIVNPEIGATITSSMGTTDVGVNVTFYSHPSQRIPPYDYTYKWDINGNTYTTANATSSFPESGDYQVSVTVTDNEGFAYTATYSEVVNSDPVVSASSNVSAADINYPIEFSSSPSGGTAPYTYSWTLNGVVESTSQDFSYSFASAGSYSMLITVTDSLGVSTTASVSVTINSNPTVIIHSAHNPTDVGVSTSFTSTESGGTGTITYEWTVSGTEESTISSMDYTFTSYGKYDVNLTVSDSDGHTYTAVFQETVNNDTTAVIVSNPYPTEVGVPTNFTADISGGVAPYNYTWSINSTVNSYKPYMVYTFKGSAKYTIGLKLVDSTGYIYTTSTDENVSKPPSVSLTSKYSQTDINTLFNITADVTGGISPYSYSWSITLGNVTTNYSTDDAPFLNTSESAPGIYTVKLTVTDHLGLTSSASFDMDVHPDPTSSIQPTVLPIDANVEEKFTPTVVNGTAPYSYEWIVSGTEYNVEDLSITFSTAGTYNITLIVSDFFGKDATSYYNLPVHSDPTITVTNSSNPTASKAVSFNASITGGISPYTVQWLFPGGERFSGTSATYTFAESGPETYQVTLTDSGGYSKAFNETIDINVYVQISSNVTSGLAPLSVSFSSTVLGGSSYAYNWTFDNGQFSVNANPTESFSVGNYTVVLIVTSANGATGRASITIRSLPPPVIVSVEPSSGTVVTKFNFTARPNWDASGPYNATWTFPDGDILDGLSVSYTFHTYTASKTVNLLFTYGSKSYSQNVKVLLSPASITVNFTAPAFVPTGTMINVTAVVTDPDSSLFTYEWQFNGQLYYGANQFFYFSTTGSYVISLTVTDSLGVTASINKTVVAEPVGTSANINIAVAQTSVGPLVTYHVNVTSDYNISVLEAFISTQYFSPVLVKNGTGYHDYNLTLNQGSYIAGDYTITFIAFASNGQSNQKSADFYVSQTYGKAPAGSFSIVSFFGGYDNFFITLMGIISSLSVVFYVRSDRKNKHTEYLNINGFQVKAKAKRGGLRALEKAEKKGKAVNIAGKSGTTNTGTNTSSKGGGK